METLKNEKMGPLSHIKVIDLTTVVMGPYATQILADFGADVIKVEQPEGDSVRGVGPMRNDGMGHIYLNANRNKRSVVLDLKQVRGVLALERLVESADVLIHNIRNQAIERLGITYEKLQKVNPRLIYVSLTGFGSNGPYAGRPAYDDMIQGAAAVPTLVARASGGEPRYVPVAVGDRSVGISAVNAVLAGLLARERIGVGQEIEVPMFETLTQIVLGEHMGGETFIPALGPTGYARLLVKERKPYATSDGYMCLLIYTDRQWKSFLKIIGKEHLFTEDPRFGSLAARTRHVGELCGLIEETMTGKTNAEWLALFGQADIPALPLHSVESLIADPHHEATGFIRSYEHPTEGMIKRIGIPTTFSVTPTADEITPAPRMGEHSVEILTSIGYKMDEIVAMKEANVTMSPNI